MRNIAAVTAKEFRDGLRNRWVVAISLIFAFFAIGLAWFGAAASGQVGVTRLSTTIASLASLAVFLIPLIALMLSYDSVVGEEERGTLLLLLTYPLRRSELLTGKFLGHGLVLALATVIGFGSAGMLIALFAETASPAEVAGAMALFVVSAILLGWVFVALAYLISVTVQEKARAAGLALVVWFLFVLVFNLALLAVLVGSGGALDERLFRALLISNPTEAFRLVNLTGFEAASGAAAIAAEQPFHPAALLGVLAMWIAVPFTLALWLFNRRGL